MATSTQVQSLYIAYFGRPADQGGLLTWTADETATLEEIADTFAGTDEYKEATEGNSVASIISEFYQNLFGRIPEIEGLNYWVAEIAAGRTTTQQVGVVIGQTAANASPANSDTDVMTVKTTAATQWTATTAETTEGVLAYSGKEGIAAGIDYLNSWTTTAPTEAETESAVNNLITENSTADTLDLTVFTDIADSSGYTKLSGQSVIASSGFKLNAQNQTLNATNTTLQLGDVLADSTTTDSDILNVDFGAAAVGGAATFQNIENINVTVDSFNNGGDFIDQGNTVITGAQNIEVTGTADAGAAFTLNAANSGATSIDATGLTKTAGANSTNLITVGDGGVTVNASDMDSTIVLGDGSDTVNAGGAANQINNVGTSGNADSITQDNASAGALGVALAGTGEATIAATTGSVVVTNGGAGARSVSGSTSTVTLNVTTGASGDTVTTGSAGDVISTLAGADTITANAGADTITGGTGADSMSGGAGVDTFVQTDTDSVAGVVTTTGSFAASDTILFANGLDIISDFTAGAGGDLLSGSGATFNAASTGIGINATSIGTARTAYVFSGTYDSDTLTFTIAAAGAGPDTLLGYNLVTGATMSAMSSWTLLDNTSTTAAILLANNLG